MPREELFVVLCYGQDNICALHLAQFFNFQLVTVHSCFK